MIGRVAAEISAIVGLITICVFLWRIFLRIGKTMDVVIKLPPKMDATDKKVDALTTTVDAVDGKVDILTVQHAETKENTHTALVRLETSHGMLDDRMRKVEQGVEVLKDRKEHPRA